MPVDPNWFTAQGDDAGLLFFAHQAVRDSSRIGVAVSGGSDSMALLHVYACLVAQTGQTLFAVTVDHGLRSESAEEARFVAGFCVEQGIPHEIIKWNRTTATGNLPDQARRARYDLIAKWAARNKITDVAVGHTADDQAETFLMRLSRASGLDGLSGMRRRWTVDKTKFYRPFLSFERRELRTYLQRHSVTWVDDPSNDDTTYDRVKARQALIALKPLGISVETLNRVTHNLSMAQAAVDTLLIQTALEIVDVIDGDVVIQRKALKYAQPEISRLLLLRSIMWVSSAEYAPRARSVAELTEAIWTGKNKTLGGCRITVSEAHVRISRELRAVRRLVSTTRQIWDGRWRLNGPHEKGFEVRALGPDGLRDCPDWRATGIPRTSLVSSPAVWRGNTLIAAPVAGLMNGWTAQIVVDFNSSAVTH